MVNYSLSEGRLEGGNREQGDEVGFWGFWSSLTTGRAGQGRLAFVIRCGHESKARRFFFARMLFPLILRAFGAIAITTRESQSLWTGC
jgi:hypothetical protein